MQYQWYPGHMARTMRQMQEDIKLVDIVIEIADARIPLASRNPLLDEIAGMKPRVVVYGKSDLADPEENRLWNVFFNSKGTAVLFADFRKNNIASSIYPLIRKAAQKKIERDRRLGMRERPVRAMVCGIPNAGKSTFINSFAGVSAAKTGNRPGVTKGRQWIRMGRGVELLDTAGVLWPKFENDRTGMLLAICGSMPDTITDTGELALALIKNLRSDYAGLLHARYGCAEEGSDAEILENIARRLGALKKGGDIDFDRASSFVLDDFRSGKTGRITLERCPEREKVTI